MYCIYTYIVYMKGNDNEIKSYELGKAELVISRFLHPPLIIMSCNEYVMHCLKKIKCREHYLYAV